MKPIWQPSPNFAERTVDISYVILHGTWMADDKEALSRLCDPKAEVSCHYLIDNNGKLLQLVKEKHTAWHAGKSAWGDIESLNHHSIGIEISNCGEEVEHDYTEQQYEALYSLLANILQRHGLPPSAVIGHSDIAPERKNDPGKHFNWKLLEEKNLAAPWQPIAGETDPFAALHTFGYRGNEKAITEAFQRRFLQQHISGEMCDITKSLILGSK